jgi:hypothetical protein
MRFVQERPSNAPPLNDPRSLIDCWVNSATGTDATWSLIRAYTLHRLPGAATDVQRRTIFRKRHSENVEEWVDFGTALWWCAGGVTYTSNGHTLLEIRHADCMNGTTYVFLPRTI